MPKKSKQKVLICLSLFLANKIEINVNSDTNQFLVLSEIYYPEGWKVTSHIDMEIYPVNMILRGLYIPIGDYKITLEFLPKDIYYGNLISSFSSILLSFFILFGLFYKQNK